MLSFLIKIVVSVAGIVNFTLDFIFRLPLLLSVALTGFLMSLPVVTVWFLFVLSHSLPVPLRATLIWAVIISLILLSAGVDYVRSSR